MHDMRCPWNYRPAVAAKLREQMQQTTALGKDHGDGYHDDKPVAECLICAHEVEEEMSKPKDQAELDAEELLPCIWPGLCRGNCFACNSRIAVATKLREALKAEANRVWNLCAEIATRNGNIHGAIRAAQAKERE